VARHHAGDAVGRWVAPIVAITGMPTRHLGWAQFRAFGAAALELCAVADGTIDAFVVGNHAALAPWDYLGAMLVCQEAGAVVSELEGRDLVTRDHGARRAVVAAATTGLLDELAQAALAGPPAGIAPTGGPPPRDATRRTP
jgi:myo-inositol-1(or 4)-monophosphatase